MNSELLYYLAKLQVTKLGTGVGQLFQPAMFVALYNQAQTRWWQRTFAIRADSQNRDKLAPLLIIDENLSLLPSQSTERYVAVKLPEDCYQVTGLRLMATKDNCSRVINSSAKSVQWIEANENNSLVSPSFEWEETFHTEAGNNIQVFYNDFTIGRVTISYYKAPPAIDVPGYFHLDNSPSTLINSPLPDEIKEEILTLLVQSLPIS